MLATHALFPAFVPAQTTVRKSQPGLRTRRGSRATCAGFGTPAPTSAGSILARARVKEQARSVKQLEPFRLLDEKTLSKLLLDGQEHSHEEGDVIFRKGSASTGLVILLEGRTTEGAAVKVLGLQELLLAHNYASDIVAESPVRLWILGSSAFKRLIEQQPTVGLILFQELSKSLDSALEKEVLKQQALLPYLVAAPKRGIIGSSKYAQRVRKQIIEASRNRKPVLIFGEPGIDKLNNAALVHFGSAERRLPLAMVKCALLDRHGMDLFGRGSKKGILELMGEGTLVLNDVHMLQEEVLHRIVEMLQTGAYTSGSTSSSLPLNARLLFTAERQVPELDGLTTVIKIPPLRVRPADIVDLQAYFLRVISRRRGQTPIALTPEALRQLQSYNFPDNIQELESMMERAASQTLGARIPEDVFWFASQGKDRFRWNLLKAFPLLYKTLRSQPWPRLINFRFTAYVYPVFVAVLLFGPQDRAHNPGLNLFWAYWWPGIFLLYPFLGRIWCSVCPFMIFGELTQKWQQQRGIALLKWPHTIMEEWGGWFLFGLFAAILIWEEAWDLPNSAALSGWLLIIITAGAVICSALFERRLWCRYLCPIGGMNGLFAKASMTEVRARQGVCSGKCNTYHCYKGGPEEPPEGLETQGCPLSSHPAQLVDNSNCVLCMDCLKACPHSSVEFRFRPPLADLWGTHKASAAELSMLFMLLGAVYLHNLPALSAQLGLDTAAWEHRLPHIAASAAVLSLPGLTAWIVDAGSSLALRFGPSRGQDSQRAFLETGYAYLPLVWGGTLAHYLRPLLTEAGLVLRVAAASVGADKLGGSLPYVAADNAVVTFLQGTVLLTGTAGSLILLRKLAARPWVQCLPQAVLISVLSAELWGLILL